MRITIANISNTIAPSDFQTVVRAVARQVAEDFEPEWGTTAKVVGVTVPALEKDGKLAPINGNRDAIIYVGDESHDPTKGVKGAYGYHSANHKNVPYGFVYLDICEKFHEKWSSTLSHEVLELLADPTAMLTVSAPAPNGKGIGYYDLEVCDPTQGDEYLIDNVVVSNFVGRSYFGLAGGSGKTNFLDLKLAPFGVRPGGYFQFEQGGKVHQVQGDKVKASLLKAKAEMNELAPKARRNHRREVRLARGE